MKITNVKLNIKLLRDSRRVSLVQYWDDIYTTICNKLKSASIVHHKVLSSLTTVGLPAHRIL